LALGPAGCARDTPGSLNIRVNSPGPSCGALGPGGDGGVFPAGGEDAAAGVGAGGRDGSAPCNSFVNSPGSSARANGGAASFGGSAFAGVGEGAAGFTPGCGGIANIRVNSPISSPASPEAPGADGFDCG
jgi:hypothetical protein